MRHPKPCCRWFRSRATEPREQKGATAVHPPSLKDQTLRDEYDDYFTKKDSLLFGADSQCGTWPTGTHGCGRVPRSCPLRGPARTGPGAFAPGDSNRARLVWLLGCLSPGMRHWKRHGADEELLCWLSFSQKALPHIICVYSSRWQVAVSRKKALQRRLLR